MRRGTFENYSGFAKISLLALAFIFFTLFCLIILKLEMLFFPGMKEGNLLRLTLFTQDLIIFISTPLLTQFFLWKDSTKKSLQLRTPNLIILALGVMAMISISPIIDVLSTWNQGLQLPESLRSIEDWMINTEKTAEITTNTLLNTDSWGGFIMNILIIAIMAGIGEELMFRGVIQKILIGWTKNIHLGILYTAIIFSTIHFQFYGFVPRMILGMVLGYLYIWSKSLWVPVIAHAINNALTVTFTPNTFNKGNELVKIVSNNQNSIGYIITGIFVFTFCMWRIWKYYQIQSALSVLDE
nr:type II CAAX endopeptidase family protein [uncultured Bacteroides sp.]